MRRKQYYFARFSTISKKINKNIMLKQVTEVPRDMVGSGEDVKVQPQHPRSLTELLFTSCAEKAFVWIKWGSICRVWNPQRGRIIQAKCCKTWAGGTGTRFCSDNTTPFSESGAS